MAISTQKLLTLAQFQTGLQASKNYTDAQVSAVDAKATENAGKIATLEGKVETLEKSGYDDTEVRGLIKTNADAIDVIEADYLKAADIANKADKATTLAGYGITDAYTKGEVDSAVGVKANSADVYTKTEVDGLVASTFHYMGTKATYAELPTEGNKVGDVWNITSADKANGIKAGDNVAWNGSGWDVLAGTVDLSAYSTTEQMNTAIAEAVENKANSATTLAGYGITDAYTKEEANAAFLSEDEVVINVATDEEVTATCNAVFGTTAA